MNLPRRSTSRITCPRIRRPKLEGDGSTMCLGQRRLTPTIRWPTSPGAVRLPALSPAEGPALSGAEGPASNVRRIVSTSGSSGIRAHYTTWVLTEQFARQAQQPRPSSSRDALRLGSGQDDVLPQSFQLGGADPLDLQQIFE